MLHNNNSHSWAWVTCERVVEVIMNYLLPIICLFIQTHFLIGFNPPDNSSGDYIWKRWAIYNCIFLIERFSFEYRKTKTKIITLANHKGHRQYSEPIKTRSNYM